MTPEPNFRFPNLDFVDWPGLTPAQRPPHTVDPVGYPWPNSIVSLSLISLYLKHYFLHSP